jgi:hypothetical protein
MWMIWDVRGSAQLGWEAGLYLICPLLLSTILLLFSCLRESQPQDVFSKVNSDDVSDGLGDNPKCQSVVYMGLEWCSYKRK